MRSVNVPEKRYHQSSFFQTTRQRMADMNALVADAENYLHVGAMDSNGKIRVDPQKYGNFNNAGEMDDSFYQVIYFRDMQ